MVGFSASTSVLTLVSCVAIIVGFVLHVTSFATNHWLVSTSLSPFIRIGFHEACLDECTTPYCPGGDPTIVYDGCYHWTFNPYILDDDRFREIRTWLIPEWFFAIRDLCIANIPLSFVSLLLGIVCAAIALSDRLTTSEVTRRDKVLAALLFINAGLLLIITTISIVVCGRFHMHAWRLDWMPMPEKNAKGFSYWLQVSCAFIFSLAFVGTLLAGVFKVMRMSQPKDPRYSEEMMLGRSPGTSSTGASSIAGYLARMPTSQPVKYY